MRASFHLFPTLGLAALALAGCGNNIQSDVQKPDTDDTEEASGPQLVVGVPEVDFGVVEFGELYTYNLTVSNPGGTDLVLTSIAIEAPFRVSPETLTVRPGGSSTVTLFLQATSYQAFDTLLTFTAEDATIGVVTLPVHANVLADADADGFDLLDAGGTDCDDTDPDVNPAATEVWYDGIDTDCDGWSDYDQDRDSYESDAFNDDPADGGGDCQDSNPEYNPGAADEPYDNRDTDCDGWSDWDADRDGYGSSYYDRGSDCDDADPDVYSAAEELLNAMDDNCDGSVDVDVLMENNPTIWLGSGRFDRAGYSVAAGDLDGDGMAEMAVGAAYYAATTPTGNGRGAVALVIGGEPLATGSEIDDAALFVEGASNGDLAGAFVTFLGDHDGDGVEDLAIGAPGKSSGAGAVYLMAGDDVMRGAPIGDAYEVITGTGASAVGRGIASRIDLDADGVHDLAFGYAGTGNANALGLVYGGLARDRSLTSLDATFSSDGDSEPFYRNAPAGGDLDGDGYEDLVLSDPSADYGSVANSGSVWVLWGGSSRYSGAADLDSAATVVAYGSGSASVGVVSQLVEDADADGDDELWIHVSGTGTYVVPGGTDRRAPFGDPAGVASGVITMDLSYDPSLLRGVGDWNGDGVGDVMMQVDDGSTGRLRLYPGGFSGIWANDDLMLGEATGSSTYGNDNVGYGLSPLAADVDGDGDLDMLAGDPGCTSNAGEAYLLLNATN